MVHSICVYLFSLVSALILLEFKDRRKAAEKEIFEIPIKIHSIPVGWIHCPQISIHNNIPRIFKCFYLKIVASNLHVIYIQLGKIDGYKKPERKQQQKPSKRIYHENGSAKILRWNKRELEAHMINNNTKPLWTFMSQFNWTSILNTPASLRSAVHFSTLIFHFRTIIIFNGSGTLFARWFIWLCCCFLFSYFTLYGIFHSDY